LSPARMGERGGDAVQAVRILHYMAKY
jgi:hypothetical protein